MKARSFFLLIGLAAMVQVALAQNTIYRMHVKLKDGSTHTVKTDDVEEIYFTSSQPYDPSNPVTADVESIHAPKEGGTYYVHINSNIPLTTSGPAEDVYPSYIFDHFLNNGPVILSSTYNEGILTITVTPTTYNTTNSREVKLYDLEETEAFSLTVSQDGDPNATLISETGNNYIALLAELLQNSHAKYRKADVEYTGLMEFEGFKAPLDPYDYRVQDIWYSLFQGIARNTALLQHCNTEGMKIFRPMCYVLNALSYYDLVTFFGGVPYYTDFDSFEQIMSYPLPRTEPNEIFYNLIEQLKSAMGSMEEKVTGYVDGPEKMYSLSKDVARVILANIYMYQGRYMEAKPLLEEIVNSNRYSLVSAIDNLDPQCSEIIWSLPAGSQTRAMAFDVYYYNNYLCILQTYGDVLLSLAECENKLNNDTKAKEYLNQVATTKGISTTSSATLVAISELRQRIQIDFGGYFAFLKRTGQAMSALELQEYQLLYPIPWDELNRNPYMTQNPGYGATTR
jgi:tetratricopeptide (TPR) repeat protein